MPVQGTGRPERRALLAIATDDPLSGIAMSRGAPCFFLDVWGLERAGMELGAWGA
jgi:hypothetical protein